MNKPLHGLFAIVMFAMLGVVSSAFGGSWSMSSYVMSEWTVPERRLLPDVSVQALEDIFDGSISTFYGCSDKTMSSEWNTAKDIESINIFTMSSGGEGAWSWSNVVSSVSVLYDGALDYVELADSDFVCTDAVPDGETGIGKILTFNGSDQFLLKRVCGIKIACGPWQCYWAHGCGELVFVGESSVNESLSAEYLAAAGEYSAKVSAVAADYPVDVYFCRGNTDGGTTSNNWDKVEKVETLSSSNDVYEVTDDTDFSYCRFYFVSARYGENVWSDGLTIDNNPAFQTSVGERHTDSVAMIATIQSPGASSSSCDVYFAYAPEGETLPTAQLVKSGVAVGEAVTNVVTGLSAGLSYDYKFVVRNAQSGEKEVSGSFSSLPAGAWNLTAFESTGEYVFPEDWLPNKNSPGYIAAKEMSAGEGNALVFEYSHPKDVRRIDLYTYDDPNGGRRCIAFTNLLVKYDGADDYVELPGTALEYREDVGVKGVRYTFIPSEDFVAENVIGLKIVATKAQNDYVFLKSADVIGQPHDYTGEYKWDFNYVDGVNFTRPVDLIADATTTGLDANENDGNISTVAEHNKDSSYIWDFATPHDITSVGMFSNSADSNRNSFSVDSIQIKYRGDADYAALPGAPFDYFNRGSNIVSCVLRPTGKYVARGVISLKVTLGAKQSGHVPSDMAEVYVSGRESPSTGFMIIVR